MTFAERVAAIAGLGFGPSQAPFLTTVALHSGYCLRRQYAAFIGCTHWKKSSDFLDGLVARNLARRITYRANRGAIYHLFGERLYAAIGQRRDRNRRHASPAVIARRLMLLDFVIAHAHFDWYPTAADRLDLLVNRFGVPGNVFSRGIGEATKTVHPRNQHVPVFLHGASPTVHFVAVVTDTHASAVKTFVREQTLLLRHLLDWSLHAVVARSVATDAACHVAYQRGLAAASLTSVSKADLEWFERTQPLVQRGDLRNLRVEDLRRYRELSASVGQGLQGGAAGPLTVHHLPHAYEQFGSLAGIC
jgi:hypothetical protein